MKKVFVILAVCFMTVLSASAQSVGYVDTEKILSCIQEYLDAQSELNDLADKYKADIQKDVDAIDVLYRDYMAKKSTMSAAQQQAKENDIIAKEKAVKEKEEKYFGEQGILTKRSEKLISPIQEAVEQAVASLPPVDALVNNAGISHTGLISQISPEEWDRLFAVNVKGIYNTVRAVLPAMLARQAGSVVNLSSMWGQAGASCEAAYSATKGAVIALTQALARELGPSGIRVNAVSPGVIDTDMNARLSPAELGELAEQTPLGRLGTPEEVAEAILWLTEASFVTGQNLPVNGGFL